jgi:hypothetical protein
MPNPLRSLGASVAEADEYLARIELARGAGSEG